MIDSHAHIAAPQFDADREALITRAQGDGVVGWVEVGTNIEESKKAILLAETYPHIAASVGVHPDDIASIQEDDWSILEGLAQHPYVCAIGEVGFDTFRDGTIAQQEIILRRFILLAHKVNKPVIFHVRSAAKTPGVAASTPGVNDVDAHAELLRVLSSYPASELPAGVIHTFSGTLEQAREYIALGMMISFSGVITFKNAGELPEVAKSIPLDSILVETDCPFLTPEPFRGQRNEPSYVRYVLQKIADIRGIAFEEVDQVTQENAKKLFHLDI